MKLSIIIPCYNVSKFIKKTINSVLNQGYSNYELILIDDGSTDNTLSILKQHKEIDNIIILNKSNGGVSSARNFGITNATGDYIMFLDGDDELLENALKNIREKLIEHNDLDMISFGYIMVKDKSKTINYFKKEYDNQIFLGHSFLSKYLSKTITQCMCSFVVKRSLINDNEIFFDENTYSGEDQEFQIKYMLNSNKILYLATPYFKYIVRESSSVSLDFSIKKITLINVFNRLDTYFLAKGANNELINKLRIYSMYQFLYVLKNSVKHGDIKLIKKVLEKDNVIKSKIRLAFNKLSINIFCMRFLYLINPNILIKLFKKI